MEHNSHHEPLKDKILKKINMDELKMRPRLYFSMQLVLVAFCSILVGLISAFLFNFLLFTISVSGRGMLLGFGSRGIISFLRFFPWYLLLIDVALIFALTWLLRHFTFGYKRPALYLLIALLGAIFGIGIFVNQVTDLNDRIEHGARHPRFHGQLNGIFEGARRPPAPPEGVCRCTITAISGSTITAEDNYFGATSTYTILLPDDSGDATTSGLKVGDVIFVVGDAEDNTIHAFGVQKIQ